MKKMIATKAFSYSTRALQAGDVFEANSRDYRILGAIGKAKPFVDRKPASVPAPDKDVAKKIEDQRDPREDLRAKAERLGVKVDARWGVPKLQAEIAKHAKS